MAEDYQFRHGKLQRPSRNANECPVVVALCGSFNPVHSTHVALYKAAKARLLLGNSVRTFQVLGGFLSPVSNSYGKRGLAPLALRVEILARVLAAEPDLEVDCWEGLQPLYTRTVYVLEHLEETVRAWQQQQSGVAYPSPIRVALACGADLFESFFKPGCWPLDLLRRVLDRFLVVVVGRPGYGNAVAELEMRSRTPGHCELRETRGDVDVVLDLSQYDFMFTVFDKVDDTSSTLVRHLAKTICSPSSGVAEVAAARAALAAIEPPCAIGPILEYYGHEV